GRRPTGRGSACARCERAGAWASSSRRVVARVLRTRGSARRNDSTGLQLASGFSAVSHHDPRETTMISKAVLEYLTQGGKKRPVVLIGFHQYRCFLAAQIGGSLIAQPVLAKVQDEQGVERVSPVPGEWQTEEHMRGRLIRASEGIYALEYVSYNHPPQANSALPREEISV